jgi:tetratricopeptide (TPR) repeat protein
VSASPWRVLDLQPSADRASIRRAYAAKLRVTQPEDDPEGFQRLREAYEAALSQAAWRERYDAQDARDEADQEDGEDAAGGAETGAVSVGVPFIAVPESASEGPAADDEDAARALRTARHRSREAFAEAARASEAGVDPEEEEEPSPLPDPLGPHREALARFARLAEGPGTPGSEELLATLEAVLAGEAMANVTVSADTEAWLARCIHDNSPRADAALARAAEAFGWESRAGQWDTAPVIEAVVEHLRDLRHLETLSRVGSTHNRAYVALNGPITEAMRRRGAPQKEAQQVKRLIELMRRERPSLFTHFDEGKLVWWGRQKTRKQRSRWTFAWVAAAVLAGFVWLVAANEPSGGPERPDLVRVDTLRLLAQAAPDRPQAWADYCMAAAAAAPAGEALRACDHALDLNSKNADSLVARGVAHLRRRDLEPARRDFASALEQQPARAEAVYGLGLTRGPPGHETRTAELVRALTMDPEADRLFRRLSLVQQVEVEVIERAAATQPRKPQSVRTFSSGANFEPARIGPASPRRDFTLPGLPAGEEATASVRCTASAEGRLQGCVVTSESRRGVGLGRQALLDAADQRIIPARLDGKTIPSEMTLTWRYQRVVDRPAAKTAKTADPLAPSPEIPEAAEDPTLETLATEAPAAASAPAQVDGAPSPGA